MSQRLSVSIDDWIHIEIDKYMEQKQATNRSEVVGELLAKGIRSIQREQATSTIQALQLEE